MTIQHRDIPNAQLHEPKDISSAVNKEVYLADGAGSGDWRLLTEAEFSYADKTKNSFGWNIVADSLYTSGSPRAIAAAARTQLTNNGVGSTTDVTRLGSIWNTGTNVLLINDLYAAYELHVACKVTAAAATTTAYTMLFELEGATGPLVYVAETKNVKGGGLVNNQLFKASFPIYSTINNVNTKIYVTPDTDINLYETVFFIRRVYKES